MSSTAEFDSKVFAVSVTGEEVRITIINNIEKTARICIRPCDYAPLASATFAELVAGKDVVLTGRGPIEAYFALGYYSSLRGARSLICEGPSGRTPIAMEGRPVPKPWFATAQLPDGRISVTVRKADAPDGKWTGEELDLGRLASLPADEVVFSGLGSVAMYALLGASAARAGISNAWVDKPGIGLPVGFSPSVAGLIGSKSDSQRKGVVVGIVGDPNSGKSVFSKVFSYCIRKTMPKWHASWIYDCDFASPTPDWYLTNVTPETAEEYDKQKKAIKVNWSEELEGRVCADLNTMRDKLDFIIADMPGGLHPDKKKGEDFPPRRVTSPSRAAMMAECDAIVVLCKAPHVLGGWTTALAEYGLESRIAAVVNSLEPEAPFVCKSSGFDEKGVFHADIQGLDRKKNLADSGIVSALAEVFEPFVRRLSYIPVVNAARAATATAFLTGDKGTRYGAAVRSAATGRIFAAGQYSSFNHSTNIHAEMGALMMAANAGEPDVDVLAIASTATGETSPCGVCRQVIVEHAIRTGRDFDVVLTAPGAKPVILPVSGLLPHAWRSLGDEKAGDIRDFPGVESVFDEDQPPRIGSEFIAPPIHPGAPDRMALVWDDAFSPDTALIKFKYERTADGCWLKLPHAFTDSAAYLRFLTDNRCGGASFVGLAEFGIPAGKNAAGSPSVLFKHPVPLSGDMLRVLGEALFAPAGIDTASSVFVTCSRMTGLATASSDWDLCVAATPEQIDALRARVVALAAEGRVTFPDKSRSWKLLKDSFPGAPADGGARIHAEHRYAESFRLDGVPVSFLFTHPASDGHDFAFPSAFTAVGRVAISGRVVDASFAPYKRSESVVETADHRRLRLLCYHKTANLLKDGDAIAATGVRCLHPDCEILGCRETLVLSAPAIDRLVWLP